MSFQCSICGEESTRICARCTKDACNNHLCEKCLRCSDCCECEVRLNGPVAEVHARVEEAAGPLPAEPPPAAEPAPAEVAPEEATPAGPEGYLPLL